MVVHDLNVVCLVVDPAKHDSPLLVHANAVEALPVALERLEVVARRRTQIQKSLGCVQNVQLSDTRRNQIRRETARLARSAAVVQIIGPGIPE